MDILINILAWAIWIWLYQSLLKPLFIRYVLRKYKNSGPGDIEAWQMVYIKEDWTIWGVIGMDLWHPDWDRCVDINGCEISFEITEETLEKSSEYAKKRNKKLQHLHKCMMQYENKTGISMERLRNFLLQRNGIQSRSELTDDQLEIEIKHFTSI